MTFPREDVDNVPAAHQTADSGGSGENKDASFLSEAGILQGLKEIKTTTKFAILDLLSKRDEWVLDGEIRTILGFSKALVSLCLCELEEGGLIQRTGRPGENKSSIFLRDHSQYFIDSVRQYIAPQHEVQTVPGHPDASNPAQSEFLDASRLLACFKALQNPQRFFIVKFLSERPEGAFTYEISAHVTCSVSVTTDLKSLRQAGFITVQRDALDHKKKINFFNTAFFQLFVASWESRFGTRQNDSVA